jgi:hypothetical protein
VLLGGKIAQTEQGLAGQVIPAAVAAPAHPDLTLMETAR